MAEEEPETIFQQKQVNNLPSNSIQRQNLQLFTVNSEQQSQQMDQNSQAIDQPSQEIQFQQDEVVQSAESLETPDDSPDLKMERQNKLILKSQKIYQLEVAERNDEATRTELIEQLKTQFAFKQVHPFDLLITYDDATVEFQLRPYELEAAFKSLQIELLDDQKRIISKYYRVQGKQTISSIKLCCSIIEDLEELMLMAINYIINKYRLLVEIFFDEITSTDKLISVESLKLLNKEWEWGLDDGKLQQIYNLMTDYGNNLYNLPVFKQKLLKISTVVDQKINQETYQTLVHLTISQIEKFTKKLQSHDPQLLGEISIQRFIDIITEIIDRALSKAELYVLSIYLQKDEIFLYPKILQDAQKLIEEENAKKQLELDKFHQAQKDIMTDFFKYIVDQTQELQVQYFKNIFKIDKETFLQLTVTLTGFQIDLQRAEQIYLMIMEDKIDKNDPFINVVEFIQFIARKKQEQIQTDQEIPKPSVQQLSNQDLSKMQSQTAQQQSKLQQSSMKQIPLSAISQPQSALKLQEQKFFEIKLEKNKSDKPSEKERPQSKEKQPNSKQENKPQENKQENKPLDNKQPEKQQQLPLRNDIYQFFNELDVEKTKSLSKQQVFIGLLSIGVIVRGRDLSISYDYYAFEKIIMSNLKTFFNSGKIIFNLKKELDQYKEIDSDYVDMTLLKLLFEKVRMNIKLNMNIKPEDINDIFDLLDKDKKGTIKMSDFFYLIYQHPQQDYRLNELLFRMKGYYDNSLRIQRLIYANWPFNYIRPFTMRANLPSYSFRIRPNQLGNIEIPAICKLQQIRKIKLLTSEGIPSPQEKKNCFKREVIVALYDKFYSQFVENSLSLKVKYDAAKEDIWIFPAKSRNNGFYLNCVNTELIMIFELISYFNENNQVQKVSCGFAKIPVSHLLNYGVHDLPLLGGNIEQVIAIEKKDIRCNRAGIAGLAVKLSGDIVPHIVISSQKISKRPSLLKELECLPSSCLCHRNMTQIIYSYRKFTNEKITQGESVHVSAIDTFLFSLDCPYICARMCKLWNRNITGKMIGQEMVAFQILLGQLQKLIRLKDFNFNPYYPQEVFTPEISKPKRNVVKSIIEYTEYLIDSTHFNKLRLDGDEILKEQMDLYGKPMQQGIFDNGYDQFDNYQNGMNLKAYDKYVTSFY